jgi:hypothetical protein
MNYGYVTNIMKSLGQQVPKFLDIHPMKGLDGALLRKLQNSPAEITKIYPRNNLPVKPAESNGLKFLRHSIGGVAGDLASIW